MRCKICKLNEATTTDHICHICNDCVGRQQSIGEPCQHNWRISQIIEENSPSSSSIVGISIEYAYIICPKCGKVKKLILEKS